MAFGYYIRRYAISIAFPSIAIASILADLLHTRRWKQQKLQFVSEPNEQNFS